MPVTDVNALIKRYQDELAAALTRALLAEQALAEAEATAAPTERENPGEPGSL